MISVTAPPHPDLAARLRDLTAAIAAAQAQPRHAGLVALVQPETGRILAVSFWATPEEMEASGDLSETALAAGAVFVGTEPSAVDAQEYRVGFLHAGPDPGGARWAHVRWFEGLTVPSAEEAEQLGRVILARLIATEGFRGVFGVAQPATGRAVAVALWHSVEAATAAFEAARLASAGAALAASGRPDDVRFEEYAVAYAELPGAGPPGSVPEAAEPPEA